MDERPTTIRIYPGELNPIYYTSVLAFRSTPTVEVIRLALQRLQIYEDKTLYELYEGRANEPKDRWSLLDDRALPIVVQEQWKKNVAKEKEMRFHLRRKEHASLILADIVSQYISPEVNEGRIEDMCALEELSEQAMLSNLRARFSNKHIYTYVGSILISINPYYFYSIYNPKYTTLYQGKAFSELPPHVFAIADNAYHSMLNDRTNQTVIISGESGAGKTESTKFLLHHLMSLSAKMDKTQSLELITLGTGPVLEAFGNARTVANNNSSRFGKFILVKFRENGGYFGASIEKYLLEKSRIISQAPGERNYHVFYYLLAGADTNLRRSLQLLDVDHYHYLTQSSSLAPSDGVEEYHRLRQSLSMLNFSDEVQISMFTVLSAILQIGNVTFRKKENEEAVQIQNMEAIKVISSLLQVEEGTLRLALTTRKSRAGGTDFFVTPYKLEEAIAARDSMAKALYGALFDWIVDQVNDSLAYSGAKGTHKGNSIGVLDIFGFEVFQKNSFEQFCINYANEQLQQYFNKHIFKLEQAEYVAEGIEWSSVSFIDNQECLDLIAKKPIGLLPLLDEECSFPGADDNSLFQKFERQYKSHPNYHTPQMKLKEPQFTILHYASAVTYSIQGFREKNRDLMRQDIVNVLKTSHMDLVRALIGLPPYAVHRWHMGYLKMLAMFAFRRAGEDHRTKQQNKLIAFHLRRGSTPPLLGGNNRYGFDQSDGQKMSGHFSSSLALTNNKSPATMERGRFLSPGLGIRASRSYDLLTDAIHDDHTDIGDVFSSSLRGRDNTPFMSYGISPRLSRKAPQSSKIDLLAPRPLPKKQQSLEHHTPTMEEKMKPDVATKPDRKGIKPLRREESRSRLPSISQLQEKLRKRWPRSLKMREGSDRERSYPKIWKTAPRVKSNEGLIDPRVLHTLARPSTGRHGPSKTVSGQFQASLVSLMERLEKTNPFFIRCIKSNNHKAPCQFDDELVLRQLRYTGMIETVKIRKAGYSVRMSYEDFYERYQFLMGPRSTDLPSQVKDFMRGLGFNTEDFQIGMTKVFMRDAQKQALQVELRDKVLARILVIQHWVRAKIMRCRFLHMRRSAIVLQAAVRGWLARRHTNVLRKKICSAVLIQSAWRSYISRKRLLLLKQAAIILQAHWRGRVARKRYAVMHAEHQRKLQEEEQRRREEEERKERERKEREERKRKEKEERERREREERERREREEKERVEREERERREREEREREAKERIEREERERRQREEVERKEKEESERKAYEQKERGGTLRPEEERKVEDIAGPGKGKRDSFELLDSEISDVLFQFDKIVGALEKETDSQRATPTEFLPLSQVTMHADSTIQTGVDHSVENIRSKNDQSNQHIECQADRSHEVVNDVEEPMKADVGQAKNRPEPLDSALSSKSPTERSSSEEQILSPKISVKELQQQFLLPSVPTKRTSISPEGELPASSVNVRTLIAQMQTAKPPSQSPPPSPVSTRPGCENMNVIRRRPPSPTVHQRISALTQGFEELGDKRQSKTYAPPPVRRRIQSPFLQSKKEKEGNLPVKGAMAKETSTSSKQNHVFNHVTAQSDHVPAQEDHISAQDDHIIPLEDHVTVKNRVTPREDHVTPKDPVTPVEDHVTPRENHVTPRQDHVTPIEDHVTPREDHVAPVEDHVAPVEDHVTPVEDHVTPVEDHVTPVEDHVTPVEDHVTPVEDHVTPVEDHVTPVEDHVTPVEDHVVPVEDHVTPVEDHVTLKDNVVIKQDDLTTKKEDDATPNFTPKVDPVTSTGDHIAPTEGQVTSNEGHMAIDERTSKSESSTVQMTNGTLPEVANVSLQPPREARTQNETAEVVTSEKESEVFSEQSSPPAANEGPLSLSPPIVVSPPPAHVVETTPPLTDEPQKKALSVVDLKAPETKDVRRQRSASESTKSTRVYAMGVPYRSAAVRSRELSAETKEGSTGDSVVVVPRDRPEGEYSSNSLQRRKREIVSIADPMNFTGHLKLTQPALFEESSEFTRCLSPEEIYQLNRHREVPSPSERLRLFSFTKRRLRLPFRLRGKKEKDKELLSPPTPKMKKTPLSLSALPDKTEGNKRQSKMAPERLLAHHFQSVPPAKFSSCEVCHKGFIGFMKHALKCADCDVMVHRHCEERAPPCKAQIESGSYVTMSRKKVVKSLEDLDELTQFLLEKITVLQRDGSAGLVDQVFKRALHEFHTSLVSSYSLSIQNSLESEDKDPEEPKVTITINQLVNNFSNIFRGIAKQEGLNDSCHISIGINQIKTFIDEFEKARRDPSMVRTRTYSSGIRPVALRRKTMSGKDVQLKIHKGHQFMLQQFKVTTVCEFCTVPIPLLEEGEVCQVCGYTCHANCYKKTMKRCEGKARSKFGSNSFAVKRETSKASSQFGVALQDLVPANILKVPTILEKCLQHIEAHGLYTQGIYRKSAGASSKKAVRTALEEDPEGVDLQGFSLHAVASAVGTFFRELPEPLLTQELYEEFIRSMDITSKSEQLETLHRLISRLPAINHAVFERLIFHLARVAQHEHINKMTPNNLAIVFAPCLLRPATTETQNPQDILLDLQKQTLCLEAIITEQVEKLTATLKGIKTLTSVAMDTVSRLTQLLEESNKQNDTTFELPAEPLMRKSSTRTRLADIKFQEDSEEERKRLTIELKEIERERVELTVNLPKLEPYIPSATHTPSPSHSPPPSPWIQDEEEVEVEEKEEKSLLPDLPSTPALVPLTKNRVSQKAARRLPSAEHRRRLAVNQWPSNSQ